MTWLGRLTILGAMVGVVAVACGAESNGQAQHFTGRDGSTLYSQACSACHGTDLRGTATGPPFLNPIYRPGHHSDAAFLLAVRNGVLPHHWNFGNMPPVAGLSDEQIAAIVQFVRVQQRAAGIE